MKSTLLKVVSILMIIGGVIGAVGSFLQGFSLTMILGLIGAVVGIVAAVIGVQASAGNGAGKPDLCLKLSYVYLVVNVVITLINAIAAGTGALNIILSVVLSLIFPVLYLAGARQINQDK